MSDNLRAGREFEKMAEGVIAGAFAFTATARAVLLLEDEIERRGKLNEYVYALAKIVLDPWEEGGEWPFELFPQDVWLLVHATPEQRARAFLEAMKNETD